MKSGSTRETAQAPPAETPQALPLIRVIAMPADANPNGDIFGGWLLSQMDLAGGSLAANLDDLYDYMARQLINANLQNKVETLDEVSGLLREIRSAWVLLPAEARTPRGPAAVAIKE